MRRTRPELTGARRWTGRFTLTVPAVLVALLGWQWSSSLVPATYSVMDMGVVELGGGPPLAHAGHGGHQDGGATSSITDLTGPRTGTADVQITLTARQHELRLRTGERVDGYTLNGTSPGPELRVRQGDLVQVTLRNADVPSGVTLHWHGVDVPNAEDGVAGVTQDAVARGGTHVYRFVAADAGTYWYHSHQVSHEQVRGGMFGVLVVLAAPPLAERDVVAAVHSYDGQRTINGRTGVWQLATSAGTRVRVRLVNTDDGRLRAWVTGSSYRIVAVDGTDVHAPGDVHDRAVAVPAGGRVDLLLTAPARVDVGAGVALALAPPGGRTPAGPEPADTVDLLSYGRPAPLALDPGRADRRFDYVIGRRPGFVDGRPGMWWTINGRLFPDVPMFLVDEGDVVLMRIENDSSVVHPMHLHGHHAVVLSRNGVATTGSPWTVDSLDVAPGHTYEIAFRADNPGIWMDHCHDLDHAADGLVAHLVYSAMTTPFRVGGANGNEPE